MFFRNAPQRSSFFSRSRSIPRHSRRRLGLSLRGMTYEPLEARQVMATFHAMGPASIIQGQVEKVSPDNEVNGAIKAIVAHPTNANILYAASVNGGIWRTNNAQAVSPHWTPLTDMMPSQSIGAMAMDPMNPDRIVAGMGNWSSYASLGGELTGLILTENGGTTWKQIRDPLLVGKNFSGVVIRGDLILATAGGLANQRNPQPQGGLFRSTDGGATWQDVELLPADTNFPDIPTEFDAYDVVADPTNPLVYFVAVKDEGVFRTDDGGENWTNVTSGDAQITGILQFQNDEAGNMKMAMAGNGRIYLGIVGQTSANFGALLYIGYSDSAGGAWTQMDLPMTVEVTGIAGLIPAENSGEQKPGGQGGIHFSIVADPSDPYIVYVGGDRQEGDASFDFGNSLGARDFSGRLFRGNTRKASIGNTPDLAQLIIPFNGYSPQWEHLTHSNLVREMPGGGTRRGSAPHADSRAMAFDAAGNLLEGDDGGIYRRTLPRSNQGDWYSINGDIQVTEFHDIAYDSVANVLVGGSQDNGTAQQLASSSRVWEEVPVIDQTIVGQIVTRGVGDGGDVAIDDKSMSGYSFRYSSSVLSLANGQLALGLLRQKYNVQNDLVEEVSLSNSLQNIVPNFVSPVAINNSQGSRIVIGARNGIFESFDRGNSFREVLGPMDASVGILEFDQRSLVAGGWKNGVSNPALLWVGSGSEVFVRTRQQDNLRLTQRRYPGGTIRALAVDPASWSTAFVLDRDDVYLTTNTGDTWRSVTGNLLARGATELRSALVVRSSSSSTPYLVVGTNTGIFATNANNPGQWTELGDLPSVPVMDMEYDITDNVLAVGTMGRGAFLLKNAYAEISGTAQDLTTRVASGVVWNDVDSDRVRDAGEGVHAGVTVYVDLNGDNQINVNEPAAITNVSGAYAITGIPKGTYAVRVALQPGWVQTFPAGAGEHVINFTDRLQATNLNFGVLEGSGASQGFDFGDAPAPFPTLLADNGASHGIVAGFQLGSTVDGDFNGRPTPFAGGDDNVGDDEDGVVFLTDLVPGTTATIQVTVSTGSQPAGLLQAWIDFDGDGAWTRSGEQIFVDRSLGAGTHNLTIEVPAWAKLGDTFARFRYGYERGLSYTGRAVAGEVEDYLVQVIKGGPTANNDSYTVRRNSSNNVLAVLQNDEIRANSETVISRLTTPDQGGHVTIATNGQTLLYTPAAGFTGTETFTYTLTDRTGLSDSATVSVFVQPDLASIRLGATNLDGVALTNINVGQQFLLRGYIQDLTAAGSGVFAAYADVTYPRAAASVIGAITYGADFPNGQSGDTTTPGLVDEVGGFDGLDRIGPNEALLFSIPMRANQAGSYTFGLDPADILPQHNVLLFDRDDAVPTDQVEYRGLSLNFTQVVVATTNPRNSLDVNDDANISAIDALLVINQLNNAIPEGEGAPMYLDVSSDGVISAIDALLIINELNRMSRAEGEAPAVALASTVDTTIGAALDASVPTADLADNTAKLDAITVATSATGPTQLVDASAAGSIFADIAAATSDNTSSDDDLNSILGLLGDDLAQR